MWSNAVVVSGSSDPLHVVVKHALLVCGSVLNYLRAVFGVTAFLLFFDQCQCYKQNSPEVAPAFASFLSGKPSYHALIIIIFLLNMCRWAVANLMTRPQCGDALYHIFHPDRFYF